MNLLEVKSIIRKMDPKLMEDTETFKIATLLLASAFVGTSRKALSLFTKLPESFIRPYEARLRKAKIWSGDKICCEWQDNDVAFWLDVCVPQGLIEKKFVPA